MHQGRHRLRCIQCWKWAGSGSAWAKGTFVPLGNIGPLPVQWLYLGQHLLNSQHTSKLSCVRISGPGEGDWIPCAPLLWTSFQGHDLPIPFQIHPSLPSCYPTCLPAFSCLFSTPALLGGGLTCPGMHSSLHWHQRDSADLPPGSVSLVLSESALRYVCNCNSVHPYSDRMKFKENTWKEWAASVSPSLEHQHPLFSWAPWCSPNQRSNLLVQITNEKTRPAMFWVSCGLVPDCLSQAC